MNNDDYESLQEYCETEKVIPIETAVNRQSKLNGDNFPEPKDILGKIVKPVFPIDSVPPIIKGALLEIEEYLQAPLPLIFSSILGITSLVGQSLVKVRRDEVLVGPVSLYIMLIADSGERKSGSEYFFKGILEDWIKKMEELYSAKWNEYNSSLVVFEARKKALETEIKKAAQNSDEDSLKIKEKELSKLLAESPIRPLSPKILYGDATLQAITASLDADFPSGGVVSGEAGAFLGGEISKELTRTLAFFNHIWSGDRYVENRKTQKDRVLDNVAITLSLAVQRKVIDDFFKKNGGLAKEVGFLARFLLCEPESTKGSRAYKKPNDENPNIDVLKDQLTGLLMLVDEHIENHRLKRKTISFDDDAQKAWIECFNRTERLQAKGEIFEFYSDIASKSADNVARIAALFALLDADLDKGIPDKISVKHVKQASAIQWYYLQETMIYLNLTDTPDDFKEAAELSRRIANYCGKRKRDPASITDGLRWNDVTRRDISRLIAQNSISKKKDLIPIIAELREADHILDEADAGRSSTIYTINPKLVKDRDK